MQDPRVRGWRGTITRALKTRKLSLGPGDWIWIKDEARPSCLSPMFKGPWMVIERRGVNLQISDLEGGRTQVVHLNRCRKASQRLSTPGEGLISQDTRVGNERYGSL